MKLFFTIILFSACNSSEKVELASDKNSGNRYFSNERLILIGDTLYGSVSKFVMYEQY